MRIALCDDNPRCLAQVQDLAAQYSRERPEAVFSAFSSPEELLQAHEKRPFDIYVLDIVMPGMNGIRLGELLRQRESEAKIIYLTSSAEYAVESFRIRAFHYLIKPVERHSFFAALDEAVSALSRIRDRSLIVKTRLSSVRISCHRLLYAELSRRAIVYHLAQGQQLESTSIRTTFPEAVRELLADRRFALCGASMAVNLHQISMVESEGVVFRDGSRAYLGKKACRELRMAWNDYWLNEEG